MLKIWQKTSQFPCHGGSQVDLGGDFPALVFLMLHPFFSVLYFFLQTASKHQVHLIHLILHSPLEKLALQGSKLY